MTLPACLGLAVLAIVSCGLGYTCYHQFYQRGQQAEARLMLSYLQTLQRVHRSEHGHYVSFAEYYGAPLKGQDNCEQPIGAAQLGFFLHGCHERKAPAPRYAYRSLEALPSQPSYHLEAHAGSDELGRSLICFNPNAGERWQTTKNLEIVRVESCW